MTENEKMIIEDESGDKDYFTIIPNYILNHSTSNDQSLYLQMKRFAGEKGVCFASERTFRKKMKIGVKALKKSIKYLLEHGWIKEKGIKKIITKGGEQEIKIYSIVNIWKLNNGFYKGVPESTPLEDKGVPESEGGCSPKEAKGVLQRATKKNHREEEPLEEEYTSDFLSFYENYPKRELKKTSFAIWRRKKLETKLPVILDFIERAKNTDRWQKGYIKQPPVFLNGECWNDDLSAYNDKKQIVECLDLLKNKK